MKTNAINAASILCLLVILSFHLNGQKLPLQKVGTVGKSIEEVSGTTIVPSGHLALINDSGNHPEVFFTDVNGTFIHKVCLSEIDNRDWEEISYENGFLYIGDFGNNNNRRKDLCVYKYKIDNEDFLEYVGKINFSYYEQTKFPPPFSKRHFDMEAMVPYNDTLYLFSKNRSRAFNGYTYQYALPATPGDYTISRIDSFKTGIGDENSFWITSAEISQDKSRLALLGYDKLWLFSNFKGHHFLQGDVETFHFEALSQKEGITFIDNNKIVITDEKNSYGGGEVHHAVLPLMAVEPEVFQTKDSSLVDVSISSKEVVNAIELHLSPTYTGDLRWEIINRSGEVIATKKLELSDTDLFEINTTSIPIGSYVLNVVIAGEPNAFAIRRVSASKND